MPSAAHAAPPEGGTVLRGAADQQPQGLGRLDPGALAGLGRLAAAVCGTRAAGVWILDAGGRRAGDWHGMDGRMTPLPDSPCAMVLAAGATTVVEDLAADPRFASTGDLRFYAGAPVIAVDGSVVGAACVLDDHPRKLSAEQRCGLQTVAAQVGTHLRAAHEDALAFVARHRLQAIFDGLPDAMVLEDPEQQMLIANRAFLALTGLRTEELGMASPAGLARMDACFADFPAMLASAGARVAAGEPARGDESRTVDGRTIERDYFPIAIGDGRRADLWRMRDVTERRRAEADLDATRRRLHTVASATTMGLVATDAAGRNVFMNASAGRMLGFPEGQVVDQDWGRFVHPDDYAAAEAGWVEAIRDAIPVESRYRVRGQDGETRHVRATISPVRTDGGGLEGFVVVLNDVTEQAETAEALADSLVVLREQNAALVHLAGARDDLVAAVSHELRTPLTSISSFVELLLGDPERTPSQTEAYEVLQRNAERLKLVVGDLLLLKDGNTGALHLAALPVELAAVVATAVEGLAERAGAASLRLVAEAPEELWAIGDAERIAQCLDNLVVNALKFTPAGGTVTVTARAAGGRCLLEVADTGIGIAPDALPQVFDRFFRAEDTGRRHGGSGLGLAIVKELVTRQGGTVAVRSTPGAGATFTIDLARAGR